MPDQLPIPSPQSTELTTDPFGEEFLSRLPESISRAAKTVPPEWLELSESELKKVCYDTNDGRCDTFEKDQRIRALFWLEMESASETRQVVSTSRVCANVMNPQGFINSFLKNPKRVAWMLCPPGSHIADIAVMLQKGNQKMAEIMDMPLTRKICRCHWGCICPKKMKEFNSWQCACKEECRCLPLIDHKLADIQVKLYEKIELRAKGSVPQVVSQKIQSVNYNVNKNVSTHASPLDDLSMEEIERRIAAGRTVMKTPQVSASREAISVINADALDVDDGKSDHLEKEVVAIPETGDN